jgi:hypothetical protein
MPGDDSGDDLGEGDSTAKDDLGTGGFNRQDAKVAKNAKEEEEEGKFEKE